MHFKLILPCIIGELCISSKVWFYCNMFRDVWYRGLIKSDAQNWSRKLTESASNLMTPTLFSKVSVIILLKLCSKKYFV